GGSGTMISMFRQELATLSIFQGLTPAQFNALSPLMELVYLPARSVVFIQGQMTDYFYILLEGEVTINYKPYDGPQLTVAHIMPGGVFGWSAALHHEVYTSAAVTETECRAYRMEGKRLKHLCQKNPEAGAILVEHLADAIAQRLDSSRAQVLDMLNAGMECAELDAEKEGNNG
ncbi:MAG TPA: cyclic nucleotide-binding domain-containing protein, partial [Longilinea sp.]|nr:cyclic nucleotide-binding domain-containing protein [Longilinea sp.]